MGLCASCDTIVALGARTATGSTIFAKNSDRPARECQPLTQAPRSRYAPGARLRCQLVEILQVEQTFSFIGSRPWWLWGLEHGINEHGVAIGNEALVTREALPAVGLLGMDLVRIALERASTAGEAMELIGLLIERYGQGGSSASDFDWRYSNGFMIADHSEAWMLESSGRQWAARKIEDYASISNRISTGSYDRASADVREHARTQGWWDGHSPFDFNAAYADEANATSFSARGRLARSRELVGRSGMRSLRETFTILRDHYEMGDVPIITAPADSERRWSLCMHTDFTCTTASMVAEIPAPDSGRTPVMWASMAVPCTGIFFPLYVAGEIPSVLTAGGSEPSRDSPWWLMKAIQGLVAQSPERLMPTVRRHFRPLEDEMIERAEEIQLAVRDRAAAQRSEAYTVFMAENVARVLEAASRLEAELRRGRRDSHRGRSVACAST
jgi:dipeptidase